MAEVVRERKFHLGDVLSITTGCLVSPRGFGGVFDILGFMIGHVLSETECGLVAGRCGESLLEQHPQLTEVDASDMGDHRMWLKEQIAKYGEVLLVKSLAR